VSDRRASSPNIERTRRNIIRAGAVLGFAALDNVWKTDPASANCGKNGKPVGNGCASNCFLKGTTIRTANGDRKIEDLAAGDLLPTVFGGVRPIQWVGHYPLKKSDPAKPWVKEALPVRIARSALAPDVPHADLYLTGGHSLFIDGLLVPVGNLINGASITRDEHDSDELEFFHIKLERHDVIFAEGAPVDTLLKVDEVAVNFAEYFRMYGAPEMEEAPCAPRATYGGGRGEFKSRIRSAMSPWLDRREPLDVIRDRLEESALALLRHEERVGV
jgi:hypothetical protein